MTKLVCAALLSCAAASPAALLLTEVQPTGSSTTTYGADFFELYNNGPAAVSLSTYTVDDSSAAFATSVALRGLTSLPAGARAVFLENNDSTTDATLGANFTAAWYGTTPPAGLLLGFYGFQASGVGLSANGDAVVLFNSGTIVTGVSFGAATPGVTFDNTAGAGSSAAPFPSVTTLSVAGTNSAFPSPTGETGSPGVPVPEPTALAFLGLVGMGLVARRRT